MVEDLTLQRKNELHDIEERKNSHINRIMQDHDKAFSDMKNYYNDITVNNMALISSLKEQLAEQKKNQERLERQISELQAENRRLVEPLNKACEENEDLKRRMTNYEKDKALFKQTKILLKTCEQEKKHVQWQFDILEQRFKRMEKERDELYERFVAAIQDVQQKTGLKNLLLEKRLQALTDVVEKKEVQLNEVLAASNLDPAAVTAVSHKLNDILDSKNTAIKDLHYELARVCKAHNDLLATCEGKLRQFGIPPEELGFQPLKTSVPEQNLGQGPAGLVSVPP
ncbi:growth arrest-specific protein 8 [Clonorchis sinensis]|nr:growth arrest-specific protein 8 [Clonorchis sinensis]